MTNDRLFLDDLSVGDQFRSEEYELTKEELFAFASKFDPQPFHLDEEAAQESSFRGLAASGWHTAAITMNLLVGSVPVGNGIIGLGVDLQWPRPVRPGETLHVVSTITEITPSRSKPDRGVVTIECRTLNQDEEVCQRMVSKIAVTRRAA